jgi:hypothetical protein
MASTDKTAIDTEGIKLYEDLAQTESSEFFGVYHVTLGQPDTIINAFEGFIERLIEESNNFHRRNTDDSKLLEDDSMRSKAHCLCEQICEQMGDQDDSFFAQPGNIMINKRFPARINPLSQNINDHHPNCPVALNLKLLRQQRGGMYGVSDENSFQLKKRLHS